MHQWARFACASVLALFGVGIAHATTQVEVVGTYPAGDAVALGRNQNSYFHLHYTSDQPVHIWARPYFEGETVNAGSNPSRANPAGSGEALGWFFLFDPGMQVDEIRISAGDTQVANPANRLTAAAAVPARSDRARRPACARAPAPARPTGTTP